MNTGVSLIAWAGVVAIERPNWAASTHDEQPMCRILSARTLERGMRAIVARVPYANLRDKFRAEDGDSVYCYAELHGDHLQILDRATQREFFLHPEQLSPAH